MKEEEKIEQEMHKILFLGPGGSGKSTIFKQLQWIYDGYTEDDAKLVRPDIHCQIITQMKDYINNYLSDQIEDEIKDDELKEAINTVRQYSKLTKMPRDIANCIKYIYQNDNQCKEIFKIHHSQKIMDESTEYFWNEIDRISADDYIPNKEDIVNVRYRTTGILDKKFEINGRKYHIFDIGGQRTERTKWIKCFVDVKAVVFVVSLSCFNEFMFEDTNKNAMVDALELFKKTINDQHFTDTPIILFLNKRDLFHDKIKSVPITSCPEFDDFDINNKNANDYNDCIKYIKSEFEAQCNNPNKNIYVHIMCAMDTQNVENVFDDVTNIVFNHI